ncbi:MAG: cell surface protein SprA [Bacteroidota bacterium]
MRGELYIRLLTAIAFLCLLLDPAQVSGQSQESVAQDTVKADSLKPYEPSKKPTFQPAYRFGDPFSNRISRSPLFLRDPSELDMRVRFNPDTTAEDAGVTYSVYESIGDLNFRPATFMSFSEFNRYNNSQLNKEYFKEKSEGLDGESAVSGRSLLPRLYISPAFDRIFGGSYVDIQPNGFVNLDFGGIFQRIDDPSISLRQQRNGAFNFDQQISMNVVGKVGEKLEITANFDNNNTFDFQNNLRVVYTGYEEDIIKKIEIGNVSMPVSNSLINGAQSLFGLKTELQFGKLFVTGIASQQRSRRENYTFQTGGTQSLSTGGGEPGSGGVFQGQGFEILASDYDENRHFFLGHFFRQNYERWLFTLPQVNSGVNVTRMEVYIINRNNDTETLRNVVGLMDLGEGRVVFNNAVGARQATSPTTNNANDLFGRLNVNESVNTVNTTLENLGLDRDIDYVYTPSARKLDDTEYSFSTELGYISLTRRLQNDEMLAVAYEYTFDGERYRVGELSEEYQSRPDDRAIYLKLLRPNQVNVEVPTWDLMMKNIYSLNASQVSQEGFQLRVIYRDDATGQDNPSLHEGQNLKDKLLIEIFRLDQLNPTGDRSPDGNFDFIENFTIDTRNGNIIFPVLEPFGNTLRAEFEDDESRLIERYVYDELYEQAQTLARREAGKNKFVLTGQFQGNASGGGNSQIQIPGLNVSDVVVSVGGRVLTEGVDYTVNKDFGTVTILNEGVLNSGQEISVSAEKADLFNFQTRTLVGARLDYRFSDNFNIGGTILHLNERPGGISRFAIGNEPTANTKYGFDINYQSESRLLTKMVDALPLVSTKEPSSITFNAEFAQLIPGTSNQVNGEGTSYIDDFENAITPINIGGWQSWRLASTPFNVSDYNNDNLSFRDNAAKIAWYTVDNSIFYNARGNNRPESISDDDLANHYERPVLPQEIFRQRDQTLVNFNEPIFDIAYFPNERGQYNYDANFNTNPGSQEVSQHWGGITRAITSETNFELNNIEYLEFWLLDPFINSIGENPTEPTGAVKDGIVNGFASADANGGFLVFNLGEVSEDVLRDTRHSFEQGLPQDGGAVPDAAISEWGQITEEQYLTDFFENTAGARENQDIGLDGLTGFEDESRILLENGRQDLLNTFIAQGEQDISADDFTYILDPIYDQLDAEIVQRYKNWNNMEQNSQTEPVGNFIPASTNVPDKEDINNNIEVSSTERYREYSIPLIPESQAQGATSNLSDHPFIADQITSGESTWYLFRVPIRTAGTDVNEFTGNDLQTIRFLRMYLTGFDRPVVLRLAQMRFVGSQWIKYEESLTEPGLNEIPNSDPTDFDISVVSIEDNSTGDNDGIRYVLPPGLERDIDNTTAQNRCINEQSLQLCVEDLPDKDSRAVYKVDLGHNLINYGRMKMFFHAEANGDMLLDNEIKAFVRLGTDQNENYYEIEFPLIVTPPNLSGSDEEVRRQVWPLENELDVSISELIGIKRARVLAGLSETAPFSRNSNDGRYRFTVVGRPDIRAIEMLMIGMRNPGDPTGAPKSVCIWANEFRVTDFDSNAGWAANASLQTKLADLATINAATTYSSVGFGSIQNRIQERSLDERFTYNVSANVNLEKFLRPDKTGLRIPMYVDFSRQRTTPKFDPLDRDVPLEASLQNFETEEERESYRRIVEDRSTSRSLNFTNVRKEKVNPEAKRRVYDIENFSFSYAYSDRVASNVNTQQLLNKTVSGGITYNYTPTNLNLAPFANSEKLSSPYFALLKDFNVSPIPSNFSFSANLRRDFRLTRFYDNELQPLDPLYERLFTFVRNYGFRWDFTKSLGLTYNATANALIDEPELNIEGDIDTRAERQFIFDQILELGRMKNFNQDITVNYTLPLGKLPFTDWISADARYSVGYRWTAGAIENGVGERFVTDPFDTTGTRQIDLYFGNFISNQRTMGLNTRIDMDKLYNKVTFLKNANQPPGRDEKVSVGNQFLKFLMMLKSVNATYSINESTSLPGFKHNAFLFGLDSTFTKPGIPFILGSQDPGIRTKAARNDWLVKNEDLNSPFQQSFGTDLDIQADLQPAKDLRVQLSWNRGQTNQYQEIFRFNNNIANGSGGFETLTPSRSGRYSTSFLAIGTSFERRTDNNRSAAFDAFEQNVLTIRNRLNQTNEFVQRTGVLYDTLAQDVLIPAFRAAYAGGEAGDIDLSPFPTIPLPNWRLDYTGLINIPALAEIFSSFTVSHGYNSTYDVSNFTNSLNYGEDAIGLQNDILNYQQAADTLENGQLVPVYIINQVMISEQFVPLIGFNIRTQNNISTRLEYRRSRTLSLQLSNAQITETLNSDVTVDFGYSKSGWKLPFRWRGRTVSLKNDITFRVAGSIRDSRTIQRRIFGESEVTNGNFSYQFRPTITYQINQKLDFTFYLERNVNEPRFGNSFRRSTTAGGFQLRFSLAQ